MALLPRQGLCWSQTKKRKQEVFVSRFWKASLIFAGLACGVAHGQTVTGNVKWTDSVGGTHDARGVEVLIVEQNPIDGAATIASGFADLDGNYSISASFRAGATGYSAVFVAQNDAGYVSADGAVGGRYTYSGGVRALGTQHIDTVIGNGTSSGQAFGIVDAMYTSWRFGASGRSAAATPSPAPVACRFPAPLVAAFGTVPYWDGTKLNIIAGGENDWDLVEHEYTHYLSSLDPLDHYTGEAHTFTVSSIPTLGKSEGMRLAWGEGLADWGGVAAQNFDPVAGHMPVGVPNVGDTVYHDTVQGFSIDLEHNTGSGAWASNNGGEGDEASVMRILWDIGDPANETHDRVALGQDELYRQLRTISVPVAGGGRRGVQSLHDVWDHFTGGASFATKASYGAIFEKYGVSPAPTDDDASVPLHSTDAPPTIHWLRQNNGENDTFEVLFFNHDMSAELLDMHVPVGATSLTLDQGSWTALAAVPGTYEYVVVGGDGLFGTTGAPLPVADQTLGYWSDAYKMVIVPTPGALATGAVMLLWRRRARAT
jgi:hypothetical protein